MKENKDIFSKEFWLNQWSMIDKQDSFNVHKGFSTPDFWDKASASYDRGKGEVTSRRIDRAIDLFKRNGLKLKDLEILDIGCGTGLLAIELARRGARITAVDFSLGMLDRFRENIPKQLENRIEILSMDWYKADIEALGWKKRFDLTIAFMSPAISTPGALEKMMATSKDACAMRGWAGKRHHPIMDDLWFRIMGTPLEDKPQSFMIKFNLLVAMGFLPDLSWETVALEQTVTVEEELEGRLAFFRKVSNLPDQELGQIILDYLSSISEKGTLVKQQTGTTGTLFFRL